MDHRRLLLLVVAVVLAHPMVAGAVDVHLVRRHRGFHAHVLHVVPHREVDRRHQEADVDHLARRLRLRIVVAADRAEGRVHRWHRLVVGRYLIARLVVVLTNRVRYVLRRREEGAREPGMDRKYLLTYLKMYTHVIWSIVLYVTCKNCWCNTQTFCHKIWMSLF